MQCHKNFKGDIFKRFLTVKMSKTKILQIFDDCYKIGILTVLRKCKNEL